MNMISVLLPAFRSVMGEVTQQDIFRSLELMGKGMLGILVVMILIFLVIKGLNAVSADDAVLLHKVMILLGSFSLSIEIGQLPSKIVRPVAFTEHQIRKIHNSLLVLRGRFSQVRAETACSQALMPPFPPAFPQTGG